MNDQVEKERRGEGCTLRGQRPRRARSGFGALVTELCFLSWLDFYS